MSTCCEAFIGYTVTLKEGLNSNNFEFFEKFKEKHGEYSLYDCKGKVSLFVGGINGEYARLVYVEEHIKECWIEGKDYFSLKGQPVPDDIYAELNKAYQLLCGKALNKNHVEYALWFHFS